MITDIDVLLKLSQAINSIYYCNRTSKIYQ